MHQSNTTFNFEILHVSSFHDRGQFIFARFLGKELDFEVKDGAKLGGIPVYNEVEMPRKLDVNNEPRLDVFVFRTLKSIQEGNFIQGQQVELVIPSN